MKTRIHYYSFNIKKPEEKEAYEKMCAELRQTPGRGEWLNTLVTAPYSRPGKGNAVEEIELETDCLFQNQWNSNIGRVFDWYEGIFPNRSIKEGHWLEITDEMINIRNNTLKCGYTGKLFPLNYGPFNITKEALGSRYLKEDQLHLLRLLPVSSNKKREPLNKEEREYLLPLYYKAQVFSDGGDWDLLKNKEEEIQEEIECLKKELEGFRWLAQRGIRIDNCRYDSYHDEFVFGWPSPVGRETRDRLRTALADFPFTYKVRVS